MNQLNPVTLQSLINLSSPLIKLNKSVRRIDIPGELTRLLEHESKVIQPHQEPIEVINLGTKEKKKEVKVGSTLEASVRERLFKLLHEYVDVFSWSYQDMPGLDIDIVEHIFP